jgi:probable rRNA maturation factor
MLKVTLFKQSNYPINSPKIKGNLKEFFKNHGIVSDAQVSVALVGEKKMLDIGKKYLKDKNIHNVLSFTPDETKEKFVYPPDGVVYLGEIMVCYPVAVKEAKDENKLIDDKVYELIEHGAMHLLGIHHEE